ncbi:MAG: GGDEF domain-containing protein, partial [Pseudomonadota bacterium]
FKRVNDRFGHQIGDEVLRHTARVIKEIFGTDQLIGRIGGEEFAVRLNHSEESEVIEKIQALRERLAGRARRRTDPPVTLSFGFGMAKENEGLESFRQRVDDALYRAKKQGRNRAIRATA